MRKGYPLPAVDGHNHYVTPEQTATSAKAAVRFLGQAFTECPKTLRRARELGLTGWAFFVAGLGAALGDVPVEMVSASIGFIAPEAVRDAWETARETCPISEIASHNLAQCRRWGAEKLEGFGATSRLVELAERAVPSRRRDRHAAVRRVAGRLRRAGAHAVPGEAGAGAQAAVLMNLLRHQRAGAHLLAVRAAGLTPLQAIAAGPEREAGRSRSGGSRPTRRSRPLLRRWLWAETLTDRISGEAFRDFDAGRARRVRAAGSRAPWSSPSSRPASCRRCDRATRRCRWEWPWSRQGQPRRREARYRVVERVGRSRRRLT